MGGITGNHANGGGFGGGFGGSNASRLGGSNGAADKGRQAIKDILAGKLTQNQKQTFGSTVGKASDFDGGKRNGNNGGTPVKSILAPGPIGKKQKMVNQSTTQMDPVSKALNEAKRQRDLQAPYVKGAETILGLMPAPGLSTAMVLGNAMGAASEDALAKENAVNPGSVKTIPGQPGGVYGRINGMMYSNRADVPGYNNNLGKKAGTATEDIVKKKKQALPTLLGAPAAPLGTTANPQMIV